MCSLPQHGEENYDDDYIGIDFHDYDDEGAMGGPEVSVWGDYVWRTHH